MSDQTSCSRHLDSPTTIHDLPNDVLTRVLSLLDASSLASLSCASSDLHSLSSHPSIWRHLCLSTWPSLNHPRVLSLPIPPHSFFSDAISSPSLDPLITSVHLPKQLISAVDIYHHGEPIFSHVMETDTSSLATPSRLDLFGINAINVISPNELTLSWILIDPNRNRAVNLSSLTPVSIDRDLYTADVLVRFGVVLVQSLASIVVTCSAKTGHIREVSLTIEDEDGESVNGEESLVILTQAMEGKRRNGGKEKMEGTKRYEEFVRRKRRGKESLPMELVLDLCCSGFGAVGFFFMIMVLLCCS